MNDITLRDYIAAKAMEAIIGKTDLKTLKRSDGVTPLMGVANGAYAYADAMLKARKQDAAQ